MEKETKITMRDEFAMAALSCLCGGSWNGTPLTMVYNGNFGVKHKLAVDAYLIADEMLKVREIKNLKEND